MITRKKIAIIFVVNNTSNAGFVNYLYSLIAALKTIEDLRKPELVIFYSAESPIELIKNVGYPFISFHTTDVNRPPNNLFARFVNKLSRITIKKNIITENNIDLNSVDYVFPFALPDYAEIKQTVNWLVDFNAYYFLDHLSQDERKSYFDHVKSIVYGKGKVVLSSYNIFHDLQKFHPDYTCKVEILRFCAMLPPYDHLNSTEIKAKHNIVSPYVMTPNQFWIHKNHMLMLKAAKILVEKGLIFQMVFTGSTKVASESDYYPSLLEFIEENKLENYIKVLGIVDRAEQLTLMKASDALVQPSLFEGWSTLVEEAKALNKMIILSDLPIHREQVDFNCSFFDPKNEHQLADILENLFTSGFKIEPHDYNKDIRNYAERILEIFD